MDLGAPGSGRLGDHVVDGRCAYGFVCACDLLALAIVALIGVDVSTSPILRASSNLLPPPTAACGRIDPPQAGQQVSGIRKAFPD